ncbi:MAG: Ig-like domain-containing protein, partial [Eubacteriales bacterium]|nr:Ig-like domain-containing protein [Eubacteriales bacterium]
MRATVLRHKTGTSTRRTALGGRIAAMLAGILLAAVFLLPPVQAAGDACGICGEETIVLRSADDLLWLARSVNGDADDSAPVWPADGCYVLAANIDLSAYPQWVPIGTETRPFTGHFDGAGYTVTLDTRWRDMRTSGLFGVVSQSTVANLTVAGSIRLEDPQESAAAGALAAVAWESTIVRCIVQADMQYTGDTAAYAGGMIGVASSTSITDCAVLDGSLRIGEQMLGAGIVAALAGTQDKPAALTRCVVTCDVAGADALAHDTAGRYTLADNLYSAQLCATTTAVAGGNPAGTLGILARDVYFLPGEGAKQALGLYGTDALPAGVSLLSLQPAQLVADGTALRPYDAATDGRDIGYEAWVALENLPTAPDTPRRVLLGTAGVDIYAAAPVITGVSLHKDGVAVTAATSITAQCGKTAAIRLNARVQGAEKTPVRWEYSLDEAQRAAALHIADDGAGQLVLTFDKKITEAVTLTLAARSVVDPSRVSPAVTLRIEPVYVTGIVLYAPASAVLYAGGGGVPAQVLVSPGDATVPGYEWVTGDDVTALVTLREGRLYAADTLPQPEMVLRVAVRTLGADNTGAVLRSATGIAVTLRRPVAQVRIDQAGGEAEVGAPFALSATAMDAQGNAPYLDGIYWASSDSAVASIDATTGAVTVHTPGDVVFTATSQGTMADGRTYASAQVRYTCVYPCTCTVDEVGVNAQTIVMSYKQTSKELKLQTTIKTTTRCLVPGHADGQPAVLGYAIGEVNTCGARLDGDVLTVERQGSLELLVGIALNGRAYVASVPCVVMQRGIQQVLEDKKSGVTATGVLPKATLHVEVVTKPPREFVNAAAKADKEGKLLQMYRIALMRDEQELEWTGKAVLRIPVPKDFQDHTVRVFWVDGQTWETTELKPVVNEEGCWVFQTDRMGFFLVTGQVVYRNISATCGQHGSISPGGQVQVVEGRNQAFRIVAEDGYYLAQVVIDGVVQDKASSKYTFTDVIEDHTIHAVFVEDTAWLETVMVTVATSGGGQVVPSGRVPVVRGQSQAFGFLPDAGYQLLHIMVNGQKVSVPDGATYTLDNVDSSGPIVA